MNADSPSPVSRRDFLATVSAVSLGVSLGAAPSARADADKKIPVGLQLYSVREQCAKDLQQIVKTKKTELLFLALFLRLLKVGGRAAVIVPEGVLFGSSNAHRELRRIIVEDCDGPETTRHEIILHRSNRIDCYRVEVDGRMLPGRKGWSSVLDMVRKAFVRVGAFW